MVNKQKILIVDDDENIAELISLYLTKECFDTLMVHDGEKALIAFDTYQPDLILLDLMLPGIDGYQVCREIRARSNVPIIMLSAKGEVFDKVLGLELGADDYIMKPFDSKEMVARVQCGPAPLPGGPKAGNSSRKPRKTRRLSRHHHQPDQLFRRGGWRDRGHAAERAGAFIFSGFFSQSGIHKRAAPGSDLGL